MPFLLVFSQGSVHLELLSTDIHVEKTFRAMTSEMCGEDFKKIPKITKHIKKTAWMFLIPWQRYKHFQYLLQKAKYYFIGLFPSSPTYSVKSLRSTAFKLHFFLISSLSLGLLYIHRGLFIQKLFKSSSSNCFF